MSRPTSKQDLEKQALEEIRNEVNDFCYLYLTCEDLGEAKQIAQVLLEKHLVACAKFMPIECRYWWQDEITDGKEVLMMMESRQDLFDEVEKAIAPLHSYDTFVLESVPASKVSDRATKWMKECLGKESMPRPTSKEDERASKLLKKLKEK
jgi:periplasmic divalent cation tolerance protein